MNPSQISSEIKIFKKTLVATSAEIYITRHYMDQIPIVNIHIIYIIYSTREF